MAGLLCETIVRLEGVCVYLCVHAFMLDGMHVYGRLLVHACVHVKLWVCVHTHVCIRAAAKKEEGECWST